MHIVSVGDAVSRSPRLQCKKRPPDEEADDSPKRDQLLRAFVEEWSVERGSPAIFVSFTTPDSCCSSNRLGPNLKAPPDHQLRIDRWPPYIAVEASKLAPELPEFDEPVYRAKQMIRWNVLANEN